MHQDIVDYYLNCCLIILLAQRSLFFLFSSHSNFFFINILLKMVLIAFFNKNLHYLFLHKEIFFFKLFLLLFFILSILQPINNRFQDFNQISRFLKIVILLEVSVAWEEYFKVLKEIKIHIQNLAQDHSIFLYFNIYSVTIVQINYESIRINACDHS